jgi:Family of unknown function (DUF6328)
MVLLMAPAAYHRIAYEGEVSADILRVGSVLVSAATIPLALRLAGDTYVVIAKIIASSIVAIIAAGVAFTLLIGLWHAYPLVAASIRRSSVKRAEALNADEARSQARFERRLYSKNSCLLIAIRW